MAHGVGLHGASAQVAWRIGSGCMAHGAGLHGAWVGLHGTQGWVPLGHSGGWIRVDRAGHTTPHLGIVGVGYGWTGRDTTPRTSAPRPITHPAALPHTSAPHPTAHPAALPQTSATRPPHSLAHLPPAPHNTT
eukprot:365227-Chlamydomonas_euryale.AAC.5